MAPVLLGALRGKSLVSSEADGLDATSPTATGGSSGSASIASARPRPGAFDDPNLGADAGLVLPATLSMHVYFDQLAFMPQLGVVRPAQTAA